VETALAALSIDTVDAVLLRRGIRTESIPEARAVLANTQTPFTPQEMVDDAFIPKSGYRTPFPVRRYGDGSWPVYYAALEYATCVAELAYHLRNSLEARHFVMVACDLTGPVLILCGHEGKYPDLVSQTESGYEFCQKLADQARAANDALHAPSARRETGTCVPVFARRALSNAQPLRRGRFVRTSVGNIQFEELAN
jgi:hypothetical protein